VPPWLSAVPGGVEIAVLARPRASRSRVRGEHAGMLKIELAAPPVDGEANSELLATIARLLRVARRQVTLVSGQTSRRKRVRVEGVEPAAVLTAMNVTR
jgi:uncharacterized protein